MVKSTSITFSSTVTKVGYSLRIVIPVPICRALKLKPGDVLTVGLEKRRILFEQGKKKSSRKRKKRQDFSGRRR